MRAAAEFATSRETGREHNESCKVIYSTNCEGDRNPKASPIIVHSLTSHADHNQRVLGKQLNCTEGQDSHSFVASPPTKSYWHKTLAYSSRADRPLRWLLRNDKERLESETQDFKMCLDLVNQMSYCGPQKYDAVR